MVVKMRDEETIWSEFVPAVSDGGSPDESMEELIRVTWLPRMDQEFECINSQP